VDIEKRIENVLILDDEKSILEMLKGVLRISGLKNIFIFDSIMDACKYIKQNKVEFLIMDYSLKETKNVIENVLLKNLKL